MAKKKRRVYQHIMEDESYQIIKKHIPKEWVIPALRRLQLRSFTISAVLAAPELHYFSAL